MKRGADDFLGAWRITREIVDHKLGQTGSLEGDATLTATAGRLRYHERGTLRYGGGAPLVAERGYLWSFTPDAVEVAYDDGAPFHKFVPEGRVDATPHLCGEDLYHGSYDLTGFPVWSVTWSVRGPRKDYRSVTWYRRA